MGLRLPALLIALVGCGRVGFDPSDGGNTSDGGPTSPVEPWYALVGGGTEQTGISRVLEDATGRLYVIGSSYLFGPTFVDGWFGVLDGGTGTLLSGGVRAPGSVGESGLDGAFLAADRIVVGGSYYDATDSEEPVVGELTLDGAWQTTLRMTGSLSTNREFEEIFDIAPVNDGLVAVGYSAAGVGSCSNVLCLGVDALVVKLRADRSLEWARMWGSSIGDESGDRVIVLPDGDLVVAGGGIGKTDFSGGAGTDVDSSPSYLLRISPAGVLRWAKRLLLPGDRGTQLEDVIYDPASNELIVAGYSGFGTLPVLAHVALDGSLVRAYEVFLDFTNNGEVSGLALADDGGLFIAGNERIWPDLTERTLFVARLAPSHDSVTWAVSAPLGFSNDAVHIMRARNGDVIAWTTGGGTSRVEGLVARVRADGTVAGCSPLVPATLQMALISASDAAATATETMPASPVIEPITARSSDLPADPARRCSP